jgi:hypothetical protein
MTCFFCSNTGIQERGTDKYSFCICIKGKKICQKFITSVLIAVQPDQSGVKEEK